LKIVGNHLHHTTLRVALNRHGIGSANDRPSCPVMSADRRTVVFQARPTRFDRVALMP